MTDDVDKIKRKKILDQVRASHAHKELADVMNTYSGRAVVNKIINECQIFASMPTDPVLTNRMLGKREIGLWLRECLLTTVPASVIIMENEARKRDADLAS